MHGVVVVVVCRGMLCLVYCVVYGVVDVGIMCVVFPGVLYWVLCLVLCAVDYSLLYALEYLLTDALERVFSSCLLIRGFSLESLRGFFLVFSPVSASLFGCVSCVFCPGFSHGI